MTVTIVEPSVVARWDSAFAAGSDKSYPSLEVVRLESWYYGGKPGRLLEYGHGSGVNLLHLLRRGHDIDAIDVSSEAQKLVRRKLQAFPDLAARVRFALLSPDAVALPYADASFDYVNCISVLSLLGSRVKAARLIGEFLRVLKPGGRAIVDVNDSGSDFARGCEAIGGDVYLYRGPSGGESPVPTWCPSVDSELVGLFADGWIVDDVGYAAHKYAGSEIREFLVCARKPT